MNKVIIAPSMLSCDLSNLEHESRRMLEAGADWLHMDIMDGNFVPNLSFGYPVLESLRKKLPDVHLDCHLMIQHPIKWVKEIVKTANSVSFHIEACNDIVEAKIIINELKTYDIKEHQFNNTEWNMLFNQSKIVWDRILKERQLDDDVILKLYNNLEIIDKSIIQRKRKNTNKYEERNLQKKSRYAKEKIVYNF